MEKLKRNRDNNETEKDLSHIQRDNTEIENDKEVVEDVDDLDRDNTGMDNDKEEEDNIGKGKNKNVKGMDIKQKKQSVYAG